MLPTIFQCLYFLYYYKRFWTFAWEVGIKNHCRSTYLSLFCSICFQHNINKSKFPNCAIFTYYARPWDNWKQCVNWTELNSKISITNTNCFSGHFIMFIKNYQSNLPELLVDAWSSPWDLHSLVEHRSTKCLV